MRMRVIWNWNIHKLQRYYHQSQMIIVGKQNMTNWIQNCSQKKRQGLALEVSIMDEILDKQPIHKTTQKVICIKTTVYKHFINCSF